MAAARVGFLAMVVSCSFEMPYLFLPARFARGPDFFDPLAESPPRA